MIRQISALATLTSVLPAFVGVVLRRFFILVLAPCLLAACGGGERVRGGSGTDAVAASGKAESGDARSTRRGGGYYKDDGPGDEIPDNLDDLPDAVPRQEPLHRFANRPYNVFGRRLLPTCGRFVSAALPAGTARNSTARRLRPVSATTCLR